MVGSQSEAIRAKRLYGTYWPTRGYENSPYGRRVVAGRLGSTGRSRVRSLRCNPASIPSTVEVPAERSYVASSLLCGWLGPQRSEGFCRREIIPTRKRRFSKDVAILTE